MVVTVIACPAVRCAIAPATGVEVTDGAFGVWLAAGADVRLGPAAIVAVAGALVAAAVGLATVVAVGGRVAGPLVVTVAGAEVGGTTVPGAQAAATIVSATIAANSPQL
jgi:hypothetical protein